MKTAEELKRAVSRYAVGDDLPVEEFMEITEAIDELYARIEALATAGNSMACAALQVRNVHQKSLPDVMAAWACLDSVMTAWAALLPLRDGACGAVSPSQVRRASTTRRGRRRVC